MRGLAYLQMVLLFVARIDYWEADLEALINCSESILRRAVVGIAMMRFEEPWFFLQADNTFVLNRSQE